MRRIGRIWRIGRIARAAPLCVAMAVLGRSLGAQADDVGPSPTAPATRTTILAFGDTASVRVTVDIKDARTLAGQAVRGSIVPAEAGPAIWSGALGTLAVDSAGVGHATMNVTGLRARRWSPESPALYRVRIEAGDVRDGIRDSVRFGFRSFGMANGRLLLNGRPLFLRGNAINPPERNLPDSLSDNHGFAVAYLRYLKSVNVNIVRLTRHSQAWFDACDEVGMLLFQGNYGTPQGGNATSPPNRPFAQSLAWYERDVLGPLASHPSVVIYVLANEQADAEIGYLSKGAKEINAFLTQAYDSLSRWDRSRLYIANAGYGFGRAGDLCDLHRYWGWYYNSFLSFYTLRDPKVCWRSERVQPITMSENTGNYTGPDGRFNLVSDTKQPDSQLNWTGHAPDAEQSARALAYQAWMGGQAIEIYRRLRERNPYLAGLTPFTILFGKWHGITRFEDMQPKPIVAQYGVSYQPVLVSWELWTPQVYAGSTVHPVVHVVNDDTLGRSMRGLTLEWTLRDGGGRVRTTGLVPLGDVAYYAATSRPVAVTLPAELPTGAYVLSGRLIQGSATVSHNETRLFVASRDYAGTPGALARRVHVYDPAGLTARALTARGIAFEPVRTRDALDALDATRDLLIFGADAWDATLRAATERLRAFVRGGGRALVLTQDPKTFDVSWLPSAVELQTEPLDHQEVFPPGRPYRQGMAVNPELTTHPALAGIDRDRLFLWSDFTAWNETKPGFPAVYPVSHGYVLPNRDDLAHTAVIANYGHGLSGVALAELFAGDGTTDAGSVVLSAFDVVHRAGLDPVADRLLVNLVRYMGSAAPHVARQEVAQRIVWGDYASERGLLTGVGSGLLLNTVPIVPADLVRKYPVKIDADGFAVAGGAGGWNTKPAVQYVGRGRRPYGPYAFTSGGAVQLPKGHGPEGEGKLWLRVPAGRTTMVTAVENPVSEPLSIEVTVNGASQRVTVPPNATATVESPLGGATALGVVFRGDRRLVLRETDFR